MYIEFKELKFKNVFSYGNKLTILKFKEGLISIVGENGNGKSTFLDALSFCLYGVPYRKIKLKELINRINKKNLYVDTTFVIKNDTYQIIRTLSPDKIEIYKNGEQLELLSSKKLIQDELDSILGIDYNMFRYVICLAVNYNKPFLSLSLPDKRDLTESMFSIKIFGTMLKKLKKNQSELKIQHEINSKSCVLLKNEVESLKEQIEEAETAIKNFDQTKSDDINNIEDKIKRYEKQIKVCEDRIKLADKAIASLDIVDVNPIKKELQDKNSDLAIEKHKLSNIADTLSHLACNDLCIHCNNELTPEYKIKQRKKLLEDQKKIDKCIEQLDIDIDKLQKNLNVYNKDIDKKTSIDNAKSREIDKCDMFKDDIDTFNNELKNVHDRTIDFDITKLKHKYSDRKKEHKSDNNKIKSIDKEMKNNKVIAKILSEDGIKAHFFKKLVPILNKKINIYLEKFSLPIVLTFDEYMNEDITSPNGRNKLSYMSHSEGEKKRIDISILLAFIDTMKIISNWQCNILFFDEMLDSATDKKGLDKILDTVKGMTNENKKICIYLISHRLADENIFNYKINIDKIGQFSQMSDPVKSIGERTNEC